MSTSVGRYRLSGAYRIAEVLAQPARVSLYYLPRRWAPSVATAVIGKCRNINNSVEVNPRGATSTRYLLPGSFYRVTVQTQLFDPNFHVICPRNRDGGALQKRVIVPGRR